MALETGLYIDDLVAANPPGTDGKSQGDDHLRLIKTALKNCFAGFAGNVLITGTDGGNTNAYTVTTGNSLSALNNKMIVLFSPAQSNSGAATLNVDGLGAKSIKDTAGNALVAGDLAPGTFYAAVYNGTDFRLFTITKNYVDQLTFSASLPAQPGGNARYYLSTFNSVASWAITPVGATLQSYNMGAL